MRSAGTSRICDRQPPSYTPSRQPANAGGAAAASENRGERSFIQNVSVEAIIGLRFEPREIENWSLFQCPHITAASAKGALVPVPMPECLNRRANPILKPRKPVLLLKKIQANPQH
jgi:hypothetical protein